MSVTKEINNRQIECVECKSLITGENLGTDENPLCLFCYSKLAKDYGSNETDKRTRKASNALISFGYLFAILGGLIGVGIGVYLSGTVKNEHGPRIARFDKKTQKHGRYILTIAIIVMLMSFFLRIIFGNL